MVGLFFDRLSKNPIIAAVNNIEHIDEALSSDCEIVFLLTGSLFNLKELVEKVKSSGKGIYVHLDLLEGFSRDIVSLKYINKHIMPDGVITTKSSLVRKAREMQVFTIQRLFILDSLSLETGIASIRSSNINAIEILPGIMPKIISKIIHDTRIPVIAGGLIEEKEDVIECLKAGAVGVSTSNRLIWKL